MGSFVYYCKEKEIIINQDIYLSFEEELKSNLDKKKIDPTVNLIQKNYLKDNNKTTDSKIINPNIDNAIINISNNIENVDDNYKILDVNNVEINNNKEIIIENQIDLQSNNGNLTLNSNSNLKSINNNEVDTQLNDNVNKNNILQYQETPNPSQSSSIIQNNSTSINESNIPKKPKKISKSHKKLPKNTISEVLTPIPEYPTTLGNYDKSKMPGDLLFNFNDIPLNEEIIKVENDLGEFIIEEKELLKYMEQYPYNPKSFSLIYPSGEKYSGYFSPDWEKEVFGIQINRDGSKYVGLFKNGMFDGRGRLILNKGDYYEGEFKQNKANGFGKYVNVKGEIYIGNWKNDKQEGEGELILKDGSRYIGQFKNGMKNGHGKIVWNDGSYYEGSFSKNYFDGYGVYMMRNKKAYIGEWKNGQMNGFGIFSCPDGKSYKGYYVNDKKQGFGIYSGKNNLRYEGKFKKGKQYGIGRIINEKGEKQLGLYLKGKRLKYLNEKDFKDDIVNIDQEIEKINNIINNNEFFIKNIGILTIIQQNYFTTE